ncbi:hypothetical protein BVY00_02065 [bacterium G20]|nr:hypothetical protein BVY00_02065 [bacterium G20]
MNEAGSGEPTQPFEIVQPPESGEKTDEQAVEHQRPASQEVSAGKQSTPAVLQPLPVIPDVPAVIPGSAPQDDIISPISSPTTAKLSAADGDLIEKQWVDKAKAIVAETKSDPFKQKSEMSKIKADYIGKRYNKIIKTDDPFDITQGRPEQGRTGDTVTA